jgi:hypothetical protein
MDGSDHFNDTWPNPWNSAMSHNATDPFSATMHHNATHSSSAAMHHNATDSFPSNSPKSAGYLDIYDLGKRVDAFYRPPTHGPPTTIILALRLDISQSIQTPKDDQEHTADRTPSITMKIVPRLFFPAEENDLDKYGWASRRKRDKAATWIEGTLAKLQSENRLTASIAGASEEGIAQFLKGKVRGLLLSLGSLIRDPTFATSCVGTPIPTFKPDHGGRSISRLAAVTIDGRDFKLALRNACDTQSPASWIDGQLYRNFDSVVVPLVGNDATTLKPDRAQALRRTIEQMSLEGTAYPYPDLIKKCIFGGIVLWGRDETSTAASSSAAAT